MATEYKWLIEQLDCYPQADNHTDVVFNICWRRQATDGNGHTGDIYGSQAVTLDPSATYIPYAELTEADVIGWLEDAMGAETLEAQKASLDKQIADQINPPVVRPALPWAN